MTTQDNLYQASARTVKHVGLASGPAGAPGIPGPSTSAFGVAARDLLHHSFPPLSGVPGFTGPSIGVLVVVVGAALVLVSAFPRDAPLLTAVRRSKLLLGLLALATAGLFTLQVVLFRAHMDPLAAQDAALRPPGILALLGIGVLVGAGAGLLAIASALATRRWLLERTGEPRDQQAEVAPAPEEPRDEPTKVVRGPEGIVDP